MRSVFPFFRTDVASYLHSGDHPLRRCGRGFGWILHLQVCLNPLRIDRPKRTAFPSNDDLN